jgi:hypothetical protein
MERIDQEIPTPLNARRRTMKRSRFIKEEIIAIPAETGGQRRWMRAAATGSAVRL